MKRTTDNAQPGRYPVSERFFRSAFLWAACGCGLHLAAEWLFFATKPSFMNTLTRGARLRILILSPLPVVLALALVFCGLALLARVSFPAWRRFLRVVGLLVASSTWTLLFFLLADNFTYTLFGWNALTATGLRRLAYVIGLAGFLVWRAVAARRTIAVISHVPRLRLVRLCQVLVGLWMGALLTSRPPTAYPKTPRVAQPQANLPHILLLTSDGLSARHLSLYGYTRRTTPFLESIAPNSLLCENAFANALNSSGSVASMLTGRLPTSLRLLYPPEILVGDDATRHLPGMLRRLGYETIDVSVRDFVDPYDLNFRDAFDEANGRPMPCRDGLLRFLARREPSSAFFLERCADRILFRVLHVTGIQPYASPYHAVTRGGRERGDILDDEPRMERILAALEDHEGKPKFIHVHWMGTHGPWFPLVRHVFSDPAVKPPPFHGDFYDDAVLAFDARVQRIVAFMEKRSLLEKTVLVIGTDHGYQWRNERIPLLFRFPEGRHAGRLTTNAQNLDVAPTLLDYLGQPVPEWMQGRSLLDAALPADRPVFCAWANPDMVDQKRWSLDTRRTGPPFYSLGALAVIRADACVTIDVVRRTLQRRKVDGHTAASNPAVDTADSVRILLEHLDDNGYDTASLADVEVPR